MGAGSVRHDAGRSSGAHGGGGVSIKKSYANSLIAAACSLFMVAAGMAQEVPGQNAAAQNPPAAAQPAPAASPQPQAVPQQTPPAGNGTTSTPPSGQMKDARQPTASERRRASKLYLAGAKLYEQGKFEEALRDDEQALALDPSNNHYRMAVEVARAHAVTALIQAAAKARMQGDALGARTTLAHAFQIDPSNPQLAKHLGELGENP